MAKEKKNKLRMWGIICLVCGLAAGIGGVMAGMMMSRSAVTGGAPETKAAALGDGITIALNAPIVGGVIGLIGVVLLVASVMGKNEGA